MTSRIAKDFDETAFRAQFDKDYDELSAYKDTLNADDFKLSNDDLAAYANKHELNKAIGKVKLSDGTGLNIDENGTSNSRKRQEALCSRRPRNAEHVRCVYSQNDYGTGHNSHNA